MPYFTLELISVNLLKKEANLCKANGPLLEISQKIYLFKIDNRSARTNKCNSYMFEVNNKDTKAMSMTLF